MKGSLENELVIFSGQAHKDLALSIAHELKVPLGNSHTLHFSNENLFPKIEENVRERDVFFVQPLFPGTSDAILEMLLTFDALKRASAKRITAVIPYYAYGRSDKKDQPRIPISARLLADMIQVAGANRVLTLDLHAGQIQGFFSVPVDELTASPLLAEHLINMKIQNPVVVSTDLGFAKRARGLANGLHAPVAMIEKRRLGNKGITETLGIIGEVRGMNAILADDEVDSAGSITAASELLIREGALSVIATCTHGLLTGKAIERLEASPISKLLLTDSVYRPLEKRISKLEEISIAPLFAKAIERIHSGGSVGELFALKS